MDLKELCHKKVTKRYFHSFWIYFTISLGEGAADSSGQVIPGPDNLIGDLLSVDISGGAGAVGGGTPDLLGGGLDILTGAPAAGGAAPVSSNVYS